MKKTVVEEQIRLLWSDILRHGNFINWNNSIISGDNINACITLLMAKVNTLAFCSL